MKIKEFEVNKRNTPPTRLFSIVLLLLAGLCAFGQDYKGSVFVGVSDSNGGALPGAMVTISASTFNRSFPTDANGIARFVGLTPGVYEVQVVMNGFNTVKRPNVSVDTGANVKLNITLTPTTQVEELVVTADTPLMDSRKVGTKTTLTTDELALIPTSRDPWAVLDTIPGIQTDRINNGGNESGQQSNFVGKGDDGTNAAWVIDGVEFTDFAAEGASQSYLDFGSFTQVGFDTGGTDVSTGSGGTVLNFVTKEGSNEHTGSMRLLFADEDFSSRNVGPDPVDGVVRQNSVIETFEKGFEIGGPIVKDRLWYWGAFNQNSIDNLTRSGQRDKTVLENTSIKIHGDITPTTRATFFYTNGAKLKDGRDAGPTRATETTWDQDGPTPIYKYEVSQLVGQNTELQFIYGRVDGGFNLRPKADPNTIQAVYDEAAGTWRNTYYTFGSKRPQRTYTAKGTSFLGLGNTDNEFNYGFEYKDGEASTAGGWGTNSNVWLDDYSQVGGQSYFYAYRDAVRVREFQSNSAWIQDTLSVNNLTLKGGLRYTSSEGNNLGGRVAANPFFPDALPALDYNGDQPIFEWKTVSPSLGATYTFGNQNQYLVRANFRRYYDNLSTNEVDFNNPVAASRIKGYWNDLNGDGQFQSGEESFPDPNDPYSLQTVNVNRENPAVPISPNLIDPNLEPPRADEFILGAEWSITPSFTVAATYTHNERTDELWTPLQGGITSADYEVIGRVQGTNPINGEAYDVPVYGLNEEGDAKNPNRDPILTNRPDYTEIYDGVELTVTKRLSNRWMIRGYVSLQDWSHDVGPGAIQNPTLDQTRSVEDGGDMVVRAVGSGPKADIFMGSASWSANVNGVVQLPWDINLSANVFAREGFAAPLFASHQFTEAGNRTPSVTNVSIGSLDTVRMDDIVNVNFKAAKVFTLGNTKVDLGVEIFNIFNDDATLQIQRRAATGAGSRPDATFGRINENLSPRIARFSATINF